jgi:hypothetical protein
VTSVSLLPLREAWRARWDDALAAWGRFTKLSEPRWCLSEEDEDREGLTRSFAMIRLDDRAVVISLRQIAERGLSQFSREIQAHEAGHHVLVPADLRDNARLMARLRRQLAPRADLAPLVGNLWADLLINDRLERTAGLDMAGVYRALRPQDGTDALGGLYLRIYENLWRLPRGDLGGHGGKGAEIDASLGARLVRRYARDWLAGASRFALLVLPYLPKEREPTQALGDWRDAEDAGGGDEVPSGLTDLEEDEIDEPLHPAEDPDLNGLGETEQTRRRSSALDGKAAATITGRKTPWRPPDDYIALMKSLRVGLSDADLLAAWYRERSMPFGIRYPRPPLREQDEPQPEGLDPWEPGDPVASIDWLATLTRSPVWIPGVTTMQRSYGFVEGPERAARPPDLYLGVDCSGSMTNPRSTLSYPVLTSVVVARAALRAGARVLAVLSGEPGKWSRTSGFLRDEREILRVLTGYLGTGTTFGIDRLRETFVEREEATRPTHILVVTDSDFLFQLRDRPGAWDVAAAAARAAGAGATAALDRTPVEHWKEDLEHLQDLGWTIAHVSGQEDLLRFGRAFAKSVYEGVRAAERVA